MRGAEEERRLEQVKVNGVWRQLFGSDSRKQVDCTSSNDGPYRYIVQVHSSGIGRCTGVLVGPRFVLTAAHCIYKYYDSNGNKLSAANRGWTNKVDVKWSRQWGCSTSTPATVSAVTMAASTGYVNNGDLDYDWAILELASRPTYYVTYLNPKFSMARIPLWFPLGFMAFGHHSSVGSSSWTVGTAGWPGDLSPTKLRSETKKDAVDTTSTLLETTLDGAQGQSGSPLWRVKSSGSSSNDHGSVHSGFTGPVYGVFSHLHSSTFLWWEISSSNNFARITPDRFILLCTWITDRTNAGEFNPCHLVI